MARAKAGRQSAFSLRRPLGAWVAVGAAATLWSLVVGWLAGVQALALNTGFDLGVFTQIVWATAHGRPFYTSMIREATNFLGDHFIPLVAALAPLYSVWPDPRLLLAVQTVALAAGVVPLFAFARPRVGQPLALLVAAAYLLSPPLHYIALFEFHEIALAVPLLMAAGAALLDRRPRATAIWLGLALTAKEEVALIAIGFGLYALVVQRRWRFGAALTAATLLWTAFLFGWLIPAFNQTGRNYVYVRRYLAFGDSMGEIVLTMLTSPATVARVVLTEAKLAFLWQLLAPLAGLPLLGLPALGLAFFPLAYLLLGDYVFQFSIRYHYTAAFLPFLFLATVVALQRLRDRHPRLGRIGAGTLLVATVVGAWWWSPLPGARAFEPTRFRITEEARAIRGLIARIPGDAAVVADWRFMPWLANRWCLDGLVAPPFQLFEPPVAPDYLLTQAPGPGAVSAPVYPWLVAGSPGEPLRVPRFEILDTTPGGVVLARRRPGDDVVLRPVEASFERGLRLVAAGTPPEAPAWGPVLEAAPGTTLPVWLAWQATEPLDERVTFTLHLAREEEHVAQVDREMGAGRFPTTRWHEWFLEHPTVTDEFPLALPAELAPGRYRLLAGAYESETLAPLAGPNGSQWVELALVEVAE